MKKYGKPKTRPATWIEKMSFRHQIGKAIDSAIQDRIAKMQTIQFDSPLLNEYLNQPDFTGVAADAADSLGIQDHTRRQALQDAVKQRLAGNRSGYGLGLDSSTEALLQDAGYGDSGFDHEPDPAWIENSLSYLRPANQIGDF